MWRRWKRFAAKAAEVQGQVLLFLLYFLVLLPMALVASPGSVFGRVRRSEAAWKPRLEATPDLDSLHRQY